MTPCTVVTREVSFPRFAEDIASGKRTLAHIVAYYLHNLDPVIPGTEQVKVIREGEPGDLLLLYPTGRRDQPNRILATITKADLGPLEVTESDCALLNVDSVAAYIERWDRLHPTLVAELRPIVWRFEWEYLRFESLREGT